MSLAEALEPLWRTLGQAHAVLITDNAGLQSIATAAMSSVLPFVPSVFVLGAVLTKSKTVAAYVQLGSIQERQRARDNFIERIQGRQRTRDELIARVRSGDRKLAELRVRDTIFYTLGVMNLAITPYIFGRGASILLPVVHAQSGGADCHTLVGFPSARQALPLV